eukprot:gene15597-biopygen15704
MMKNMQLNTLPWQLWQQRRMKGMSCAVGMPNWPRRYAAGTESRNDTRLNSGSRGSVPATRVPSPHSRLLAKASSNLRTIANDSTITSSHVVIVRSNSATSAFDSVPRVGNGTKRWPNGGTQCRYMK